MRWLLKHDTHLQKMNKM